MDETDRPASEKDSNSRAEPVEEDASKIEKDASKIEKDASEAVTEDTADDYSGTADDVVHNDANSDVDEAGRCDEESDLNAVGPVEESVEQAERTENNGSVREKRDDSLKTRSINENNSLYYRFRHDNDGALMWLREMLSSVAIVLILGLILFAVSGVWPPMVAVESGSMEPNMGVGDLVFITEPGRFAPDAATNDIGVVTHQEGIATEYQTFGSYGSVMIFQPPGRTASPIIHRAMFHVEEGENWYDQADEQYHSAADCSELQHCPAPHDGFITLGDNNGEYDQANGLAAPVKADWVTGVARLRVPYLGYVRLIATGQEELGDVLMMSVDLDQYHVTDPIAQNHVTDPIAQNPTRENRWVSSGAGTNGTEELIGSSA